MSSSQKPPYLEIFGLFFALFPIAAVMVLSKDEPWYQSLMIGMLVVFFIEFTMAAFIKGTIYGKLEKLIQSNIPDEMQAAHAEDRMDAKLGDILLRMFSFILFVVIYVGLALLADLIGHQISEKIRASLGISIVAIAAAATFILAGMMAGASLWLFADMKRSAVAWGAVIGGLIGLSLGIIRSMPDVNTSIIGRFANGISIGFCMGIVVWFCLTLRAFARSGHSPVLGFLWIVATGTFAAGLGISAATLFHQMIPSAVTVVGGVFLILLIVFTRRASRTG